MATKTKTNRTITDREIFDEAVRAKGDEPTDEMWKEFVDGFNEAARERVRNRAKNLRKEIPPMLTVLIFCCVEWRT